jgi:hypothetical protein
MPSAKSVVKPRVKKVRRIVTGHDAKGRSVILSDKASPHVMAMRVPTFGVTDLWRTSSTPADNTDPKDPCSVPAQLAPAPNGTVVRVVEFPPDKVWMKNLSREQAFASLGKSGTEALAHSSGERHPMMHRTKSIDYAIVLSGEIWAVMDVGETKMRAGDVLIQRGTNHAWANRSNRPARVAFVLIDAKPV